MFNTYLQKLGERLDAAEKRIAHLDSNQVPGAPHQYLIRRNQSQMSLEDNQRRHIPMISAMPITFASRISWGKPLAQGQQQREVVNIQNTHAMTPSG
jgi:hypothetical protein